MEPPCREPRRREPATTTTISAPPPPPSLPPKTESAQRRNRSRGHPRDQLRWQAALVAMMRTTTAPRHLLLPPPWLHLPLISGTLERQWEPREKQGCGESQRPRPMREGRASSARVYLLLETTSADTRGMRFLCWSLCSFGDGNASLSFLQRRWRCRTFVETVSGL